ncbi:MAG: CbiX/SirB N-terminal domain-containing protein [Propionibacteriales bacterium]|nr:CbiX/SirB N-terminal domain-containing protein [Propionibacteriales bacterium]
MSAPTLLLLAPGDDRPATLQSADQFLCAMRAERPDLDIRLAHASSCLPSVAQTVNRIVRSGATEVIIVGLDMIDPHTADSPAPDARSAQAVARHIGERHPQLKVIAARDFGPEPALLNVVDQQLRSALADAQVTELDGLVLAAPNTGDARIQAKMARCARQWSHHHRLPVIISSARGGGGVTAARAVGSLRADGRRHIAVGSWFLTADALWESERDAALAAGAVAVADPLGAAEESVRVILSRYAFAAMDLLDAADPVRENGIDPVDAEFTESRPRHLTVVSA